MADYLNIAGRVRTTASDGVAMEAQEVKDLNQNKSQQEINADVQTELGDRYTKEETYNREEIAELVDPTNYVSVVATNATTAVTDILPATGEADTIYRVGNWNGTQYDPTMYALYAWNGSAYVCLAVRSFVGEVYDISVNHPDGQGNPTPYADLTAALGTNGANIPADIRRGGMSIKFIQGTVQSSDNNYVSYMYRGTSTAVDDFTNTANWEKVNLEKEVEDLYSIVSFQTVPTITYLDNNVIQLVIPTTSPTLTYFGYIQNKNGTEIFVGGANIAENTYTIPRLSNLVCNRKTGLVSIVGNTEIGENILLFRNVGDGLSRAVGIYADYIRNYELYYHQTSIANINSSISDINSSISDINASIVNINGDIAVLQSNITFQTVPTITYLDNKVIELTIPTTNPNYPYFGYIQKPDNTEIYIQGDSIGSNTYTIPRLSNLICNRMNGSVSVVGNLEIGENILLFRNADGKLPNAVGIYADYIRSIELQSQKSSISNINSSINGINEEIGILNREKYHTTGSFNIIARQGYNIYNNNTPPQQSIASYKLAFDKGYKIFLTDVRVTSDGIFVCCHDDNIKDAGAKNMDGSTISETVLISTSTYATLLNYDFGIYKGQDYARTPLLKLVDFLKFCKFRNCKALLELKVPFTQAQMSEFKEMVYSIMENENDIILCNNTALSYQSLIDTFPRVTIMGLPSGNKFSQANIDAFASLSNPNNNSLVLYPTPYQYPESEMIEDLQTLGNYAYENGVKLGISEVGTSLLSVLISNNLLQKIKYAAITLIDEYYLALENGTI